MKGRIFGIAVLVVVGAFLFLGGRQAQASIEPVLAVENVFAALNAGEVDAAVAAFASDASIENRLRGETYAGASAIKQMLQGMHRAGRQFDIVYAEMDGDCITVKVEVSDHGIVWGTQTVVAELRNGKLQTFHLTDFRLQLWRIGK